MPVIIKEIFSELGYTDLKDNLSGSYREWEYCVQYRETDFNFVSRLMEQEGIYYYFIHEDGKHTLCLADGMGSHKLISGYEKIPYYPPDVVAVREEECINGWHLNKQIQPGCYVLNDYDYIRPKMKLKTDATIERDHNEANHEIYDYPGEYTETEDGNNYAKTRIQELQAQYEQAQGRSLVRGLICGGLFSLTEYPREDQNREYLVTSLTQSIHSNSYEAAASTESTTYANDFTAIESKTPFRAARITPKPIVQGPQTAFVVGPSGEEIHTDKHGRVKLQFHWDRYGKSNENSSCWVRVSQLWAGQNWGGIHIPRMGQEVIVEFLEGDPDRPIVTGRVYNGDQIPPYALPANKTQSGIKSRSSKGGSGANFNEVRMEDKKGEEQLYIHAEKNQDNIVENDETTKVGHDRTEDVDHDETINIGNNRTETVGACETLTVTLQRTHLVGINETIGIGAAQQIGIGAFQAVVIGAYQTVNVGAYQNINVGINQTTNVGANQALTVGAYQSIDVGIDQTTDVGADQSLTVGGDQSESVTGNASKSVSGDDSLGVDGDRSADVIGDDFQKVGKNLLIDAGDSVTIMTGSASITMKKDGTITIKGKEITVDGSGKIDITATKNITLKGQKILQN